MIKPSAFFTAWVSDLVKFPAKDLGTMAAIWPSTERVNVVEIHTRQPGSHKNGSSRVIFFGPPCRYRGVIYMV
jgi:hypothetical protein